MPRKFTVGVCGAVGVPGQEVDRSQTNVRADDVVHGAWRTKPGRLSRRLLQGVWLVPQGEGRGRSVGVILALAASVGRSEEFVGDTIRHRRNRWDLFTIEPSSRGH